MKLNTSLFQFLVFENVSGLLQNFFQVEIQINYNVDLFMFYHLDKMGGNDNYGRHLQGSLMDYLLE